jgi:cytochrome c biogenesis protein CcmG, thiol:disulfide interchange protein DsbE
MTDRRRRPHSRTIALLLLSQLLVSGVIPPAAAAQPAPDWLFPPLGADGAAVRAGEPAPALEWTTPDGTAAALKNFRGELVVLVFWASWCPWCRKLWPLLRDVAERHAARPRVLPINIWDEQSAAEAYAARPDFTWPLRVAADGIAERWHVRATPHLVVVNPDGRVAGIVSGFDPEATAIRALLDGSQPQENSP